MWLRAPTAAAAVKRANERVGPLGYLPTRNEEIPMTKRQRVLELIRTNPGLTSSDLLGRLYDPDGSPAIYRPDGILSDLRKKGLIRSDGGWPQRYYPIAVGHVDEEQDAKHVVIWKWV